MLHSGSNDGASASNGAGDAPPGDGGGLYGDFLYGGGDIRYGVGGGGGGGNIGMKESAGDKLLQFAAPSSLRLGLRTICLIGDGGDNIFWTDRGDLSRAIWLRRGETMTIAFADDGRVELFVKRRGGS